MKNISMNSRDFLLLYFLIFSIGLIKIVECIAIKLIGLSCIDSLYQGLYEWAADFRNDKPLQITFYLLSIITLFVYYSFYWIISKNISIKYSQEKHKYINPLMGFYLVSLGVNILLAYYTFNTKFTIVVWIILFFSPLFCKKIINIEEPFFQSTNFINSLTSFQKIFTTIVIVITAQYIYAFSSYMFGSYLIENDYINLSEQTILKSGIVDNIKFINAHHLYSLFLEDPRSKIKNILSDSIPSVKIPDAPGLKEFTSLPDNKYRYAYDSTNGKLTLKTLMTPEERIELSNIVGNKYKSLINKLNFLTIDENKKHTYKIYTVDEREFLRKNSIELSNQAKAGWYFFHHSYVLSPLNAVALGAPITSQTMLYGWLSSLTIKKSMDIMGGLSYQSYFKSSYAFYPLYFLLFIAGTGLIFRKIGYVALAGLLLISSTYLMGYDLIGLAPGLNPIRHFFDVLVFIFLYRYFLNKKMLDASICLILGVISILWSKDFGAFILLSSTVGILIHNYLNKKFYTKITVFCLIGLTVGFLAYLMPLDGKNIDFIYMFLGLTIPVTQTKFTFTVLIMNGLLYALYTRLLRINHPMVYLSHALFLYFQMELLYYC